METYSGAKIVNMVDEEKYTITMNYSPGSMMVSLFKCQQSI